MQKANVDNVDRIDIRIGPRTNRDQHYSSRGLPLELAANVMLFG